MLAGSEILDDVFGQVSKPRLYSRATVLWFTFLFSPLVGGALMFINLNRTKRSSLGLTIFLASLIFTLGNIYLGSIIPYRTTSRLLVLMLNLIGANLLSGPVWKNTLGAIQFERANPWFAFAVVLVIYASLGVIFYIFLLRSV